VFKDAARIVGESEELSKMMKVYRNSIYCEANNSAYNVLSAEAYSKEGLNPTFVMFDELHAQPNRDLFDVMSLAQGSRGGMATMLAITTAGVKTDSTGRDSIAYDLYQYGQRYPVARWMTLHSLWLGGRMKGTIGMRKLGGGQTQATLT